MPDWTSQFDGSLEVCPSLTDDVWRSVPARRGVLLLLDEAGRPLILLTAADLRARLRGLWGDSTADGLPAPAGDKKPGKRVDWKQVARQVLWKSADSHFETDLHYLEAARRIWPEGFAKMLAWRPAWFVHVDPADRAPHFAKVARLLPPPGVCLGPFLSARSAQGFIDIFQDAFDLCRDSRRLLQAPRARPCTYRQMGRCPAVCDGSTSMDAYRATVAQAAAYAAGERASYPQQLAERMKQAAAELKFEEAAAIKARLDKLGQLDGPAYAHVAMGEAFQFILVQRGSRKAAKVFLADRGLIVSAPPLAWPLKAQELQQVIDQMAELVRDGTAGGRYDPWCVGLVASYLFGGPQRRGVILRWQSGLAARELGQAVEQAAAALNLGRKSDRTETGGTSSSADAAGPL